MDETEQHAVSLRTESPPLSKWKRYPFFIPLTYALAGLLVLFVLVILFATYVLRLKVETAVVSADIETMVAPASGYITDVFVDSGESVTKGTPLLKIQNLDLEREWQLARVQAEESRLAIHYYEQLLANEQQRLKLYKKIGQNRVVSAQTTVNMSQQAVTTAKNNLKRFTSLHKQHYVSEANLEAGRATYMSAQEKLKHAQARQRLEHHALDAVKKGMYFTGAKTEGIERDLYAELEIAQKKATLNDDRVMIYEGLIHQLTLKAPFDGKITQLFLSAGNTTHTVKPVLFIEKTSAHKKIIAYLTQDEVIHIGDSGRVDIYIPSLGKTYRGKAVGIDRTDGFIDEVKAQYRWRDFNVDRSAQVTVAIQQSDQKKFDKDAYSGMPVIVYFSKNMHF